ncbi:galactosamine-containing minor teichoic acid biosynthesis protein [Staphylococcus piscifermentans]|uniref:CDP-glycerol glycerophosphotransferase n=1 Tax=Staphylococcus piscifermentans TaxID=70258 RepID=A0A239TG46_9STAP|nr:CDP-glycerol glycerophosphotransferase family protein [Staphylococcus piscifermentans]GEP83713.1 CDP-glycerol glycerophosphotransferase [Staphylococcus piscifermentans]SNU95864.1 galactosamine-containing minor teichoic acid biosynthesis protein [Staphylococcus piscifermentans]
MLEELKYKLTKSFEVHDVYMGGESIIFTCRFENFINFNTKKLEITVNNKTIPFEVTSQKNNEIVVMFKTQEVIHNRDVQKITFSLNGKQLWVTAAPQLKRIYQVDHHLYQINISKSVSIKPYNTGHMVMDELINISLAPDENESLVIESEQPIEGLLLINQTRMKTLDIKEGKINYAYIQDKIKKESFIIYAIRDTYIYPININTPVSVSYYFMNYRWWDNTVNITRDYYKVDRIDVSQFIDDDTINLTFQTSEASGQDDAITVGVTDSDYSNVILLPTFTSLHKVSVKIPISLLQTPKRKKLFIRIKDKTYLLRGNMKKFSGYRKLASEIYQLTLFEHYGVTIAHKKPKIKMGVNAIGEKQLNIYFQPHEVYRHCDYYLTFEERESSQQYQIPIQKGEQDIALDYAALNQLLTKKKSIIDVFVTIYDGDQLVRKDKIKFKEGIYKKDSVYTLKKYKQGNQTTYFMLTLTPFKNIKFETFELSDAQIQILNDNNVKKNNIWMIGERTDTAQESGIQFFEWLQDHADAEVYYVIDGDSEDYQDIKDKNNVLRFGSDEHLKIAAQAKVLMSTHDVENIMPYKAAPDFWGYEDTIKIFLQHGVLGRKNVEYHKKYYDDPFDLFNVSSGYEKYDIVVDEMGYKPEEIAVTGLARFDRLPLEPKKQLKKVLIMPTWRDWLNSNEAFEKSEYLSRYLSLVNSEKLKALSETYDLEINFYPHYRAQQFFQEYLEDAELSHVNFIELGKKSVQDLLIEHDLLITDYSTVSTDFNYMNKPVIFYHFDVSQFFRKGILRPIDQTFIGDIVYSENELVSKISDKINSEKPVHYDRSLIFDYIDHQNSQRIYDEICAKLEKE